MRRAWPSSARPWRLRSSTPWWFSASSASSADCAMRWPVSAKPRASLPSKNLEVCGPCRRFNFGNAHGGLLFSKNLRVGGLGGGGRGSDVERCVESDCDWGKTKFAAAGLVAELERNVLFAERGVFERGDRHAKNHVALVDVQ